MLSWLIILVFSIGMVYYQREYGYSNSVGESFKDGILGFCLGVLVVFILSFILFLLVDYEDYVVEEKEIYMLGDGKYIEIAYNENSIMKHYLYKIKEGSVMELRLLKDYGGVQIKYTKETPKYVLMSDRLKSKFLRDNFIDFYDKDEVLYLPYREGR